MNEEPKQQAVTATKVNVKQKVLFVLAVIGLIGFGFAVALVSEETITPDEPVTQSYVEYAFSADTSAQLEQQMLAKAAEMNLTSSQIKQAVVLIEEGAVDPTTSMWPSFGCSDCDINRSGQCVFGGCLRGGCKFRGDVNCWAEFSIAF